MKKGVRRKFTDTQIEWIKSARRVGRGWTEIGAHFNCHWETVRRAVDPTWTRRRAAQFRARRANGEKSTARGLNPMIATRHIELPDDVKAERDHALAARISITATFCGDPLPGRSALDKKRSGALPCE